MRLLTVLAKLLILSRDLDGFVACIEALAGLLQERWDEVQDQISSSRGRLGTLTGRGVE